MKKGFFISFVMILFFFLSCQRNDDEIQFIDQQLRVYIDSLGQDMLNSNITGSYNTVSWNDILADKDIANVSYTKKLDSDSTYYLYYLAGATREIVDSMENFKRYKSEIAFNLTKKINDSTTATTRDTLILNYTSTPTLFSIESAQYNGVEVFTKTEDGLNIIKINK